MALSRAYGFSEARRWFDSANFQLLSPIRLLSRFDPFQLRLSWPIHLEPLSLCHRFSRKDAHFPTIRAGRRHSGQHVEDYM